MYTFAISLVILVILLLLLFIRLLIEANSKILALGKNEKLQKGNGKKEKHFLIKGLF